MSKTATRSDFDEMSVAEAREILQNTRGRSDATLDEAQRTMREWYKTNAGRGSCRCSSICWIPGEFGLECERCGTLSEAARQATEAAAAKKREKAKAAEAASAPKPRQVLAAAAAALTDAQANEARLEAASVAGRDQLAAARTGLDAAEAALAAARERIARGAVDALLDPSAKKPKTVASELAVVATAGSELELARVAAQEVEDRLADAQRAVRRLEQRHREAALVVLSDECAPLFIARATEARTEFVAASRGLRWLEHAGVAPTSLIAAELRWSWSNVPHSWTASDQRGPDLDTALKALLRDPHAPVGEWA